jgi:hypothetical protein
MYKKFRLYKEFGSLNSTPVFSAFEQGVKSLGLTTTDDDDAIPVIWSVLWRGRMSNNKAIYESYRKRNIPVVIVEVGNFSRGITWRVSINNVNRQGIFSNNADLDPNRPNKLGISLTEFQEHRRPEILITGQHEQSLQWEGQPSTNDWLFELISKIKLHTDRKLLFRPHPRSPVNIVHRDITIIKPIKIHGTYDDYDFNSEYHCVINHNSGPGIQAAVNGVPVIVDSSSLAYPVSNVIDNIEQLQYIDRTEWIIKLAHTEWTIEEISKGIPLKRLLPEIESQFS